MNKLLFAIASCVMPLSLVSFVADQRDTESFSLKKLSTLIGYNQAKKYKGKSVEIKTNSFTCAQSVDTLQINDLQTSIKEQYCSDFILSIQAFFNIQGYKATKTLTGYGSPVLSIYYDQKDGLVTQNQITQKAINVFPALKNLNLNKNGVFIFFDPKTNEPSCLLPLTFNHLTVENQGSPCRLFNMWWHIKTKWNIKTEFSLKYPQDVPVRNADNLNKIHFVQKGGKHNILQGHTDPITHIMDIDETTIVSSSCDKSLKMWDIGNKECIHTFTGHTAPVTSVARIDEKTIVSSSNDTTLKLWDLEKKRCIATLKGHTGPVNKVIVLPESKKIVSCSDDTTVKIWESDFDPKPIQNATLRELVFLDALRKLPK